MIFSPNPELLTLPRAPRVLVLLATYNGEHWLREQINSILSQKGVTVSILIGDDRSNDGTIALLDTGWAEDPRITVHRWPTGSGSAGANFRRLYLQANVDGFDFVALADQDDIWSNRKLVSAVEALQRTGACGYSSAVEAFWPDGRKAVLRQNPRQRNGDFLFEGGGQGCTFVLTSQLFRTVQSLCRQSAASVGELHYHDWLIYLVSRAIGGKWYFDPAPQMRYRQHAGNEIGARGGLTAVRRRVALISNGWYKKQVTAAIRIYQLAGGSDPVVNETADLIAAAPSFPRRVRLGTLLFKHGRRSLADRFILVIAAMMGWL